MKQDLIDMKKELVEFRKCHSKAVLILSVNDDLSDREAAIFEILNKIHNHYHQLPHHCKTRYSF